CASSWIKRISVHRCVEDVVALLEEMLRAIAVVHVEVEDENALDALLFAKPLRRAGDGVEETEAHRLDTLRVMAGRAGDDKGPAVDRKSTRLNSSHDQISYAVFCLKKKKMPLPSRPAARPHFWL